MELKELNFDYVPTSKVWTLTYNNYILILEYYTKKLYKFDVELLTMQDLTTFTVPSAYQPYIIDNKLYIIYANFVSGSNENYYNNFRYQYFDLIENNLSDVYNLDLETLNNLTNITDFNNDFLVISGKNQIGRFYNYKIDYKNNVLLEKTKIDKNFYYNYYIKTINLDNKNIFVGGTSSDIRDNNKIYKDFIQVYANSNNLPIYDIILIGDKLYYLFENKINTMEIYSNLNRELITLNYTHKNGSLAYLNKKLYIFGGQKIEYLDFTNDFNTFTFYDKNKNVVKIYENQSPLKSFKSKLVNDFMFINLDTQTNSINFNYLSDKNIRGYLLNNDYYFKINEEYTQNIPGDINFYEIVENEPLETDTNIIFYKYDKEINKVDKSNDLEQIANIKGFIFNDFDYKNFDIMFKKFDNYLTCNYAFIPKFNKYYFIKIKNLNNDMILINFDLDILHTYKYFIYSQKAFINRANKNNNYNLFDNNYIKTTNNITEYQDINLQNNEFNFNTEIDKNVIVKMIKPGGLPVNEQNSN